MSVSLNQSKGVEGWNYTFEVSPASLSFDAAGGTKQVSVTSYRCQTVNGIENGVQENVGYSSSVSGDGFSASGASISAAQNNTLSGRVGTVTLTQEGSSKQVSVSLNQNKGNEGWNYTFEVSPSSLSFDAAGGTKQVSVTSYRRQTVNGIENGVQENVGYSSSVAGEGFSSAGTSVTAEENLTSSARSGSASFTQNNSGKLVSVSLSQERVIINTITFKPWDTYTGYDVTTEYPLASDINITLKGTHRYNNGGPDIDEDFTEIFSLRKDDTESAYYYDQMDLWLTVYEIVSISPERDGSYRYVVKIEEYSN